MKERPILFSAPMIRAILEDRKTVTRRVVKAGVDLLACEPIPAWEAFWNCHPCPYGQPGDRLWVRETWGVVSHAFDAAGDRVDWRPDRPAKPIRHMQFGKQGYYSGHIIYAADGYFEWCNEDASEVRSAWKPSIHMPRIASRITLEITSVRVERLLDIREEGAIAEGCKAVDGMKWHTLKEAAAGIPMHDHTAKDAFEALWDSINGEGSSDANPWVWVVEFKRAETSRG